MSDRKTGAGQAHGLRYPFEDIPEEGKPIEVADGIFWVRMTLPYSLDHINLWLLRDGDGWSIVDTCVDTLSSRAHY